MPNKIKKYLRTTDFFFLLLCAGLSVVSVITLASVVQYGALPGGGVLGNHRVVHVQIFASVLGLAGAVVCSLLDTARLLKLWPYYEAVCWGLVLLTFIPGVGYAPQGTDSQSWIAMPFGASFQPTELAKIAFCLGFALHLQTVHAKLHKIKTLLPVLLHLLLPVLLIHFQGDDGTAMVFFAMGVLMLFAAGLNRWVVISCVAAVAAVLPVLWRQVLSPYQRNRILGLFYPELYADTTMYQQLQGRSAISDGGLWGRGLFQPQHTYVPRAENDFIFSYYAESAGFIGSLLLLALLFAVMYKVLSVALKAPTLAEAYVCVGIFAALMAQALVNLGMNLMLLPVSGLTLPFVSAGGTSVLMLYLSIGLVLGVERHAKAGQRTLPPAASAEKENVNAD